MAFELTYNRYPDPDGIVRYAHVPWDSQIFGFPCYELDCEGVPPEELGEQLGDWLKSLNKDSKFLICTKIPAGSINLGRVLTRHGFYFIELAFNIYLPLPRFKLVFPGQVEKFSVRKATEAELQKIADIASRAFWADRYHMDPNVSSDKAGERYASWVRHGFDAGDSLQVVEDVRTGEVMGFFHFREKEGNNVDLSLSAVDLPYQGAGVGAILYQAVLSECKKRDYVTATTHISSNNLAVVNLFSQLGFSIRNSVATYHFVQGNTAEA